MSKTLTTWARRNDLNVYVRNAGPTLSGLLAQAAQRSAAQVDLEDEVDLARAIAMRATMIWSACLDGIKEDGTPVSDEAKMLSESAVRDSLDLVVKTVAAAAKVRLINEGAVQLSTLSWVVGEITRVLDEEVRSRDPYLADRVVQAIGAIKMPSDKTLLNFQTAVAEESFL